MCAEHVETASAAVLKPSTLNVEDAVPVKGYAFEEKEGKVDYERLFDSFLTTGFQATQFAQAVNHINEMVTNQMNLIWLTL
jgi:deoxyhypusine synthase